MPIWKTAKEDRTLRVFSNSQIYQVYRHIISRNSSKNVLIPANGAKKVCFLFLISFFYTECFDPLGLQMGRGDLAYEFSRRLHITISSSGYERGLGYIPAVCFGRSLHRHRLFSSFVRRLHKKVYSSVFIAR